MILFLLPSSVSHTNSTLVKQEALLRQRDHATCLSVEILQLRYKTSHLKTRVPGLSCGIICVILRLAVFTQYWNRSVTDTHAQTDRRTDRYTTTACIASRGKNRPQAYCTAIPSIITRQRASVDSKSLGTPRNVEKYSNST